MDELEELMERIDNLNFLLAVLLHQYVGKDEIVIRREEVDSDFLVGRNLTVSINDDEATIKITEE